MLHKEQTIADCNQSTELNGSENSPTWFLSDE